MSPEQKVLRAPTNKKVCFIAGAGHSGSTLVGMVLGSLPDCFYAGEAGKTRYLHNSKKDPRKRMCKLCGPECPVWSGFHVRGDIDLYEQISQTVDKPIVIDSTKNLKWLRERVRSLEATSSVPHFIFLQRDGRAVINSRVRKYPNKDPEDLIGAWVERMVETQALFDELTCPKAILRYEEFASEPERMTRQLCQFLNIDYLSDVLDFYLHEHHPLGGNNGTQLLVARHQGPNPERPYQRIGDRSREYYEKHIAGIKLDLRWKTELDPEIARLFDRVAGDVNDSLRWEG
jgi:hypothetical protein